MVTHTPSEPPPNIRMYVKNINICKYIYKRMNVCMHACMHACNVCNVCNVCNYVMYVMYVLYVLYVLYACMYVCM